jgi:hypothetical protein
MTTIRSIKATWNILQERRKARINLVRGCRRSYAYPENKFTLLLTQDR